MEWNGESAVTHGVRITDWNILTDIIKKKYSFNLFYFQFLCLQWCMKFLLGYYKFSSTFFFTCHSNADLSIVSLFSLVKEHEVQIGRNLCLDLGARYIRCSATLPTWSYQSQRGGLQWGFSFWVLLDNMPAAVIQFLWNCLPDVLPCFMTTWTLFLFGMAK